jgi:uncharacterized membrane protein YbaN (DUF454 family)
MPDLDSIMQNKNDAVEKINKLQEIGLPGVKDVAKVIWQKIQDQLLLSPRQIAKKLVMLAGESLDTGWFPGKGGMTEEDAQLMVYGKVYYKNGKLYDKDYPDSAWVYYDGSNFDDSNIPCIGHPGDEDYFPPMTKDHAMFKEAIDNVKKFKAALQQIAIHLGEFLIALPNMIITIAISLVSLVSSIIILPPGAGIPTALTAVQTMLKTLKDLQAAVAVFLPPIEDLFEVIGQILPKSAQPIINMITGIISILFGIISAILAIVGIFDKIMEAVKKLTKKSEEQEMKTKAKAEPATVEQGESTVLTAEVTGGSWDFDYEWTGPGGVISNEQSPKVTPNFGQDGKKVTYTCKATDKKSGTVQTDSVKIRKA